MHAAHLEALSRLLQLELAGTDHLLGQLIAAFREQHRVLGYMKFVTPELEAQYKVGGWRVVTTCGRGVGELASGWSDADSGMLVHSKFSRCAGV